MPMLLKFFAVATACLAINADALTLGAKSKVQASMPEEIAPLPNLLAQAHVDAIADASASTLSFADTEVDSETMARALAAMDGNDDAGPAFSYDSVY